MSRGAYIGIPAYVSRNLPSGCMQFEYIETYNSESYIDTRFTPNQDTRVVMDIEIAAQTPQSLMFGARTAYKSNAFCLFTSSSSLGFEDQYGNTAINVNTIVGSGRHILDKNKNITSVDGQVINTFTYSTFTAPGSLYLFDANNNGAQLSQSGYPITAKLYSCKIYDNGALVRDFVPCQYNSNLGLYDVVNDQFYQSSRWDFKGHGAQYGNTPVGIAREIKNIYIGQLCDIPIHEEQTVTTSITTSNIAQFFTVENSTYYFAGTQNTYFVSNNGGVESSTAQTSLTAKKDLTSVSFTYSYSTETNYDKFTLTVAGTTIKDAVSGIGTSSWSGSLTKGQTIVFKYTKDTSYDGNQDMCEFYNMSVTSKEQVQVGSESKEVACAIKKAYIGIGGVARPCFPYGAELSYYGTIGRLDRAREYLVGASFLDRAWFAGGYSYNVDALKNVDVYTSSLTKEALSSTLSTPRMYHAGTSNNTWVYFGGGQSSVSSEGDYLATVDYYSTSLIQGRAVNLSTSSSHGAAASTKSWAVFARGYSYNYVTSSVATAYSVQNTQVIPNALQTAVAKLSSASFGRYAIFAGGCTYSNTESDKVDYYNDSLTHGTLANLQTRIVEPVGTASKTHAIFSGGRWINGNPTNMVTAYDQSLTATYCTNLSNSKYLHRGASVKNHCIFARGGPSSSTSFGDVESYDDSLTKTVQTNLSKARKHLAAASVRDYALFAGGDSGNSLDIVDVFLAP